MNKIYFEKLTPLKNIELKIYSDALDFVFKNNDIRNVGISGPYSSGKSSVIESYKQRHKELDFLHISLANFESIEQENSKAENANRNSNDNDTDTKKNSNTSFIKESILEGKILNQLLHQIDVSKIPQTNFRVKQKISNKDIFKTTLKTIIFLSCFFHIYFYYEWINVINNLPQCKFISLLKLTTRNISLLFSGLIIIVIFGIALYSLIKIQKNKSLFKRFSVQGNEIEIFEENDESYFDKYLNEVLYLFDNADADVIVFEDMDRYNVKQIFQRLREVNMLINLKREKENKKPLRFFYLIKDDIFISKDRTKFFDFIMPVVPIIDGSNSYDKFISHLKKGGIFKEFDEHFLQGISLYVDDMRILKNIYNEFIVYYSRIGTTEQDYNKLLAMIVYKNIFPRDFSDTQLSKGFVFTLLNRKDAIIKDEIDRINEQIKQIRQKVELCDKEYLHNIDELNSTYTKTNYGGSYIDTDNNEYIDRKERIELIQNNGVKFLKDKILQLESEKVVLKNRKMQKIITRENIDDIFNIKYKNFLGEENDFKEIKSSQYFDLIKYLIWNGYIDETYEDYMTYFYPNSLTKNDKIFLRSIADRKAKDWTYKINNPKLVLSRLREVDFDEIETLNFDLFNYILNTESINKKYLIKFIEQLEKDKHFRFMEGYFNVVNDSDDLILYVKIINHYWPSFLAEIFIRSEFCYEEKKEYILLTIYYCNNEDVDIVNTDNILSIIISSDAEFLNIKKPKVEKLIVEFLRLNIKFKNLNYEKSHKNLFNAVYQNKLYEFTFENISLMLKQIYNVQSENDIQHKNFSLIVEQPTSKLLEYVKENINQYLAIVIDNCDGVITDSLRAVLKIINNRDIELSKKKDYIEYLQTQLDLLEAVHEKSLWDLLLQKKLIKYCEINILYYYFKNGNGLNESLIKFINSNSKNLEFSQNNIDESFGEGSKSSLFDDLIICETLIDDKYKNIVAEFEYEYPEFTIEEISEAKIRILIELGIIKMTAKNVAFMRKAYKSQFIYFIEYNISKYVTDVIENEPISYNELLCILDSNINDNFKIDLISYTNESIQVISKNYSDDVKKYILQHNFNVSELLALIDSYESQSDTIKEVLNKLCEKYLDDIIEENLDLPIELFEFLISKENILIENKLILLTAWIDKLSKLECENYIKMIGSKEHEKLFGTRRPKFEVNEVNKNILQKFKNKCWISDFYIRDDFFRISRKKLHKI